MGQPTKSKSFILTSCLVAVSFAIINCQKAPNRNGVKPNVTTPAGTNTSKTEETAPKSECSTEIKKTVETMRNIVNDTKVTEVSSAGKTAAEKDILITKRKNYIENCDAALKELDKVPEKTCLMDKAGKADDDKNKVLTSRIKRACDETKARLAEDNKPAEAVTGGTATETAEEKRKREEADALAKANKAAIDYLKSNLQLVSDEVKDMISENKDKDSMFKKFLVGGDIKSDRVLERANSEKQVICSISGEKIDKSVSKSITLNFVGTDSSAFVKAENVLDGFKGDAVTMMLKRINDHSEKAMLEDKMTPMSLILTCLNLKSTAVNVDLLKKALGIGQSNKHIKQITNSDLESEKAKNKTRVQAEIAAANATTNNAGQQGRTDGSQGGTTTTQTGTQTGGAPAQTTGSTAVDEKTTLVRAVTAARMELGTQKQKVDALKVAANAALEKVNAAKKALAEKKIDSAALTAMALKIKEAGEAKIVAEQAEVEAKKGADDKAKKEAADKVTAAKEAVKKLEAEANKIEAIKALGTNNPAVAFMQLQLESLKANELQVKAAAEHLKEEAKIKDLQTKLDEAITKAKAKGATQQEIDAPATVTVVVTK